MKYDLVREQIQDGDLLSVAGSWLFSRLIRWETGQDVSHCGFAVWQRFGRQSPDRLFAFESMEPHGVRTLPLSYLLEEYAKQGGKVFWQPLKPGVDRDELLGFAYQMFGKPYAKPWQFVVLGCALIRIARIKLGLGAQVGNGVHCSQLTSTCLWRCKVHIPKLPCLMTPGDVSALPCFEERIELEP